jgi:hypothetical protein
MTLNDARNIIDRRNRGEAVSLHEHAAAATYLHSYYATDGRHLTRPARFTTDATPKADAAFDHKLASFRDGLRILARRGRTGNQAVAWQGEAMPMPTGIWPKPPPIEAKTGIPMRAPAVIGGDQAEGALRTEQTTAGWSEGVTMMGAAHPVTPTMMRMTEGPTPEQMESMRAADAKRCRDTLTAINRANCERWAEQR